MSKGATENAIKYGVGQLSVGIGTTVTLKQAKEIFRELEDVSKAMANLCDVLMKESS